MYGFFLVGSKKYHLLLIYFPFVKYFYILPTFFLSCKCNAHCSHDPYNLCIDTSIRALQIIIRNKISSLLETQNLLFLPWMDSKGVDSFSIPWTVFSSVVRRYSFWTVHLRFIVGKVFHVIYTFDQSYTSLIDWVFSLFILFSIFLNTKSFRRTLPKWESEPTQNSYFRWIDGQFDQRKCKE